MKYFWTAINLVCIFTTNEACKSTYEYLPGGPPREAEHNPYEHHPAVYGDYGWPDYWKSPPYKTQDYVEFMKEYKKKLQEAKERAKKAAQNATNETGDKVVVTDPQDPHGLGEGGIKGPKGPFGPNGPFGGDGSGFGPEGAGGFGDKGRYGPDGPPKKQGGKQPYLNHGAYAKYPAAWGLAGIKPAQAIHDGVPFDVDVDWPEDWTGIGLPEKGSDPPPWAYEQDSNGQFDECYERPDYGWCGMKKLRYAYNPYVQHCSAFIYGGCGGNYNNFLTYRACMEVCGLHNRDRLCQYVKPFEDYTEWPETDLVTSERPDRRMYNTSLLRKIILNEITKTNDTQQHKNEAISLSDENKQTSKIVNSSREEVNNLTAASGDIFVNVSNRNVKTGNNNTRLDQIHSKVYINRVIKDSTHDNVNKSLTNNTNIITILFSRNSSDNDSDNIYSGNFKQKQTITTQQITFL